MGEPIEVKKELVERYKMGGKEKHDVENGWPPSPIGGERAAVCDQHEHVQRDDDGPRLGDAERREHGPAHPDGQHDHVDHGAEVQAEPEPDQGVSVRRACEA